MRKLNDIMQMLNWNNNAQTQEQGMNFARQITEIEVFFQPMEFGSKAIFQSLPAKCH